MLDFIIIGGGTAGLSAAVYACRANKKNACDRARGVRRSDSGCADLENYPGIRSISGAQFASDLFDQAEALGASFKCETVISVARDGDAVRVTTDEGNYSARAVIRIAVSMILSFSLI